MEDEGTNRAENNVILPVQITFDKVKKVKVTRMHYVGKFLFLGKMSILGKPDEFIIQTVLRSWMFFKISIQQ